MKFNTRKTRVDGNNSKELIPIRLRTEALRKKKKWSLVQLSKKSGVARGYLCELEKGKYENPGGNIICKLCKALETTPNDLIEEKYWR